MKKIISNVIESGERLYIHPISIYVENKNNWFKNLKKNKILYFQSREFPPYSSELLLVWDDRYFLIDSEFRKKLRSLKISHKIINFIINILIISKYVYFFYIKRLLISLIRLIQYSNSCFKFKFYTLNFLEYIYKTSVPFWGIEQSDICISVNGQLFIYSKFLEEIYLTPTQLYLEKRVKKWIKSKNHDVKSFLFWKKEQESLGRKILYLCSLDT